SDCWYKPFGCEYNCFKHKLNDHLSSEFKFHFDLVMKFIQTLQEQLKSQIQKNENNSILMNENISLKKEIARLQQDIIQSNSKKDNEIKKIEKESQQELLKLRADIEIMKQDFIEKEKLFNQSIKLLQEKNNQLSNKEETKDNDNISSSNVKHSSTFSFDLFCSSSKLLTTFSGHTGCVYSIDYSTFGDCQYLCSGSLDNTIRVWDVETNKQIRLFKGNSNPVYCVKFSSYYHNFHGFSHRPTVCSSSNDQTIRFWDFETSKKFQ
ncbi:hypothetical protein RFI_34018, partial [Reticulomyxa filosa]